MGKPFLQYMQEVPKHVADRIGTALDHAVKAIADGSQSAQDAVLKELADIQQHTNSETMNAVREELRDRLTGQFRALGAHADKAAELADSKLKTLWDKAEKFRGADLKHAASDAGHWAWLKMAALGAVGVAAAGWAIGQGAHEGASVQGNVGAMQASLEAQRTTQEIQVTRARMDELVDNLAPPQINLPASGPAAPAAMAAPPVAAAAPMPILVAAKAPQAATVTVYDSSGQPVRTSNTTVGEVWRRAPEARPQIEERSGGHNIHGDINVTAPFGPSISIRF